ncbi:hypothetical protein MNBD_GAMMA10-263 [hydrothermal vent metagenome]|uniref:Type 4 fimbrial biogenesis protein PilX N-terminal domain-containing protein n=1 Tax=hydrothermal vent metagenome TaxID=652676 RepID=A0A3B0XYZ3_9ZZZZ
MLDSQLKLARTKMLNGRSIRKHAGSVLITAIVLMVIFTLLGVAAMRMNMTDISIQGSMKNRSNAFQCAEAAIRAGEIWLDGLSGPAYEVTANPQQSSGQVWEVNNTVIQSPELQLNGFWQNNNFTWAYGGSLINSAADVGCKTDPRYFIESLGAVAADSEGIDFETLAKGRSAMYRITAYSTGIDDNATVVLQTTYLQPIN